jgi:uncharacterized protein DUF3592
VRTLLKLVVYGSLLVAPLLAASLWLDACGETVTGSVTGKREEIHAENEPTGGWYSRRFLEVDIPRLAAVGLQASVRVDSAEYARIQRGDRVRVRYLSCCPIFARLDGRTTRQVSWEAAREFGSDPVLDWVLVGFVALVIAARIATPIVLVTGVAWLGAGLLFLFPDRPPRAATGEEATARVAGIVTVSESPRRTLHRSRSSTHPERLTVPYQVVQLRLVPGGAPDSVLAVDEVDAGSAPSLAPGAVVRVRYRPAAPREAMLVEGTRTFRQRNRFHFLFLVVAVGGIGIAAGLTWRLRGRRAVAAT